MNILLIEQLKKHHHSSNHMLTRFLTTFSILPTLYIRRLAAITPKNHQVTILNERYDPLKISTDYDVVVIHFNTASSKIAYEVADQFREKNVTVILSGLHASALPEEALEHADSVLLGRGECNWLTLLNDAEQKKLKRKYEPTSFGANCHIPPTNVKLPGFIMMGAIEATRGCPYRCSFCPEGNTPNGDHFYMRPVDDVIHELEHIPQKIVMFYDMSLTINPEYTKQLFTMMKPLKKRFFCNGNIDILASDSSFVKLSKEAGCIGWLVGFESFRQDTLDAVGKKTNQVKQYKKAIDLLHRYKQIVIGDFMFGFDTDTAQVFQETSDMLDQLQIDAADFTILTPFPGTPLFNELKKQGRILTTEWEQYTMFNPVFQPKQMNPDELKKGVLSLYQQFYAPKRSFRRIIQNIPRGMYPFASVTSRNLLASFNTAFLR